MRATREAARRLRECNPVADDAYAGAAGEHLGQITFNHIITSPAQATAPTAAESATAPGRRRRAGLLAGGLGLIAAGVAAAIVVASAGPAIPAGQSGARQVLLASAAAAAARPGRSGSYWYVRMTTVSRARKHTEQSKQTEEIWAQYTEQTWTQPGGQTWARGPLLHSSLPNGWGKGLREFPLAGPAWMFTQGLLGSPLMLPLWRVRLSPWSTLLGINSSRVVALISPRTKAALAHGAGFVTYGQLQHLPANPGALMGWLMAYQHNFGSQTGLPEPEPATLIQALVELVAQEPAPPAVRAAAFRAIAEWPNATSLGPDHGGQGLRISLGGNVLATLIVDPATSQTRESLTVPIGANWVSSVSVTAQWVNSRTPPVSVTP